MDAIKIPDINHIKPSNSPQCLHYFVGQPQIAIPRGVGGWKVFVWTLDKIRTEIELMDKDIGTQLLEQYEKSVDKDTFAIYFVLYKYSGIFCNPRWQITNSETTFETLEKLLEWCTVRKITLFESAELTYNAINSHPDLLRILSHEGPLMTLVEHQNNDLLEMGSLKTVASNLTANEYLKTTHNEKIVEKVVETIIIKEAPIFYLSIVGFGSFILGAIFHRHIYKF